VTVKASVLFLFSEFNDDHLLMWFLGLEFAGFTPLVETVSSVDALSCHNCGDLLLINSSVDTETLVEHIHVHVDGCFLWVNKAFFEIKFAAQCWMGDNIFADLL